MTTWTQQRSVGNVLFDLEDESMNQICDQDGNPIVVKGVFTPGDTERVDERE